MCKAKSKANQIKLEITVVKGKGRQGSPKPQSPPRPVRGEIEILSAWPEGTETGDVRSPPGLTEAVWVRNPVLRCLLM